jgi:hypothetical protein
MAIYHLQVSIYRRSLCIRTCVTSVLVPKSACALVLACWACWACLACLACLVAWLVGVTRDPSLLLCAPTCVCNQSLCRDVGLTHEAITASLGQTYFSISYIAITLYTVKSMIFVYVEYFILIEKYSKLTWEQLVLLHG